MTQDEIKKGLEYAAKVTGNGVFAGAYKIITEQEREIEKLKKEVKQAQIDMLNEVKKCSQCDNFFPDGNWHRYVLVSDIDILIEEVQNDTK